MKIKDKFFKLSYPENFELIYNEIMKLIDFDNQKASDLTLFAKKEAEKSGSSKYSDLFIFIDLSINMDLLNNADTVNTLTILIRKAKKSHEFHLLAKYYNLKANLYSRQGKLYYSYLYYWKAIKNILKGEKPELAYIIYINLGYLYNKLGYYQNALDLLMMAFESLKDLPNKTSLGNVYCVTGYTYYNLNKLNKANEALNNSIEIKNKQNSVLTIAICQIHQAEIFIQNKDYNKAENLLETIISTLKTGSSFYWLSDALIWQAIVKLKLNKFDDYHSIITEAENLFKKSNQIEDLIKIQNVKSDYYYLTNNTAKSLELLNQSLIIAKENSLRVLSLETINKMIMVFTSLNNFEKAFHLQKEMYQIKSLIENEKTRIKLAKFKSELTEFQKKLDYFSTQSTILSSELKKITEKELIGISKKIRDVYDKTVNIAKYENVNVLITGESGTGKEIIASIIHYSSNRKNYAFIPVNCSAIPEQLIESEFFGHKKGAFTGAVSNKTGLFQAANQGTIFLDEIGDMPISVQAKLLRVIEEKKIKKIGEDKEIPLNFRIVAATNKNLAKEVEKGNFRLDLYHRLSSTQICIPALRDRAEDIPHLINYFLENLSLDMKIKKPYIDEKIIQKLCSYDYPGNIRELKNIVETLLIHSTNGNIQLNNINFLSLKNSNKNLTGFTDEQVFDLEEIENKYIDLALKKTNYNKTHAAKLLGISRDTLIRKLKKAEFA